MNRQELSEKLMSAQNKIHHLSMRYGAAVAELAKGEAVAFLPTGYPGLKEMRDLVDLILLCRSEINAITKILVQEKIVTEEGFVKAMIEEYTWFIAQKEKQFGFEVTDLGLTYTNPRDKN